MKKGPTWSKTITRSLLQITHTLWLHRNKHLHNNDNPEYVTKEDEKLHQQIKKTYTQGSTGISPNNQSIFDISQEEIMRMPTPRKRQWLASVFTAKKRTKVINLSQTTPVFYTAQEKHNYTIRSRNLSKSSTKQFRKWRLRHHPYASIPHSKPIRPYDEIKPTSSQTSPQITSHHTFLSIPPHLFLPNYIRTKHTPPNLTSKDYHNI